MVKRARELEMQHMTELKVVEDSDRDACMAETGRPPIPTVKRHVDDQQLMRKTGRRCSLQLLRMRHSDCS